MNASKVLLALLGLAALTVAAPGSYEGSHERSSEGSSVESSESTEDNYEFKYTVKDKASDTNFGRQESRDRGNVQGSYSVKLPDGRLQIVTYYVDGDSGYVAEVRYEGQAKFDDSASNESNESN